MGWLSGAKSWSEDLTPLFATIEYADGDGCVLVASKTGIQVSFEEWFDYDRETFRMGMEDMSHEYILAFAEGLASYLTDMASRMDSSTFLSRTGFTVI